ncbi:MAG: hypothetical protein FWD99_06870 [Oscillospiraceae bacterium]|nr:hypothetical protein [Oscillospiraceae bacterium]
MSDSTKNRIIRVAGHAALLFVLYVLQTMIFSRLRLWDIAPLILPLAVVGVGLFEGPSWGGGFGLAAGVFSDTAFADTAVLFTLLLTALGMGIGLLSTYLLSRGFPSYLLCSALALMAVAIIQLFPFLVFDRVNPLALLRVAVLQTLYSMFFILPLYYLTRFMGKRARIAGSSQ